MPCAVSYKIVDSTGTAIPNAIFFVQRDVPVEAGASDVRFNRAVQIQADGAGEGTVDLLPGNYSGAAQIGTILQGAKDRRFRFAVPDDATADLEDLIDAIGPEVPIPNLAALEAAADRAEAARDDAFAVAGIREFRDVATLLANTTLDYGAEDDEVQVGDIIRTRAEGFSYEVVASGEDVETAGGVKLRLIGTHELPLDGFGPPVGVDARAVVQSAIDRASGSGQVLRLGARTYRAGNPLYFGPLTGTVSSGNVMVEGIGRASVIEKNHTQQGTFRTHNGPQDDAYKTQNVGDLPSNITLRNFTVTATEWEIGGQPTNTPFNIFANNVKVEGVTVDKWSGWAFRVAGFNHTYRDIHFIDPLLPHPGGAGNPDGLHILWGNGAFIENITGGTGDDALALGAQSSWADRTGDAAKVLKNVTARGVRADCVGSGRVVMSAVGDEGILENISISGAYGSGATGFGLLGELGGIIRGYSLEDFDLTGAVGSGALVRIPAESERISITRGKFKGTTGPAVEVRFLHDEDNVEVRDVTLDFNVETASTNTQGLEVLAGATSPATNYGLTVRGLKIESRINFSGTSASAASLNNLNIVGADIRIEAENLGDGKRAVFLNGVFNSRVVVIARKASGATDSRGLAFNVSNVLDCDFRGSDLRGVDVKLEQRPHVSNSFQGVWGVLAPGQGPDLTIVDGTITVTHEEHVIDTEGAAAADDLDVIATIPNLPNGLLLTLRSTNNSRNITLRDVTAISADAGAIRAGGVTLGNTDDRIVLRSRFGNWFRVSSEDNS